MRINRWLCCLFDEGLRKPPCLMLIETFLCRKGGANWRDYYWEEIQKNTAKKKGFVVPKREVHLRLPWTSLFLYIITHFGREHKELLFSLQQLPLLWALTLSKGLSAQDGLLTSIYQKIFKGYSTPYSILMVYEKIIVYLKEKGEPCTQKDIAGIVSMNRAVLLGYLRCLVETGKIRSKDSGKAKIYFL